MADLAESTNSIELIKLTDEQLTTRISATPTGSTLEAAKLEKHKRANDVLKTEFAAYVAARGWDDYTVSETDICLTIRKVEEDLDGEL